MLTVIIDYESGNLHSAEKAFQRMARETGAGEEMTEGIIDNLRAVDGIRVAAVVRDQVSRGHSARKISLRAGDDHTDVSVLARKFGGGGHVRAAGCSTEMPFSEIVSELCAGLEAQPLPD